MTKAIIVIDLPEGSNPEDYKVDLKIYNFKKYRGYTIHDFNDENVLKPMPEEMNWFDGDHFEEGYNQCIHDILNGYEVVKKNND